MARSWRGKRGTNFMPSMSYNAPLMELERLVPLMFVVYCTTVGIVLAAIPWTPGWTQMLSLLPYSGVAFFGEPWVRGAVSGFGLVHLLWGLHDLREILRSESERR